MKDKIVTENQLKSIILQMHVKGKRVVSTSGCFDILHAGHVSYLEEARARGDILVVLLNSDSSVRQQKGPTRPIVTEQERAIVLSGLECVNYICLFNDLTPCRIIEEVKPDMVIKGGDYQGRWIPEMDSVAKYGGQVQYVSIVDGCSTTNIVKKIESKLMEERE